MAQTHELVDRRNDLRRRIYLLCLVVGTPVLAGTWVVHRHTDAYLALAYPPFVLVLTLVAVGLATRRMPVRTAERLVLFVNVAVYLTGLAVAMLSTQDLSQLRDEMTVGTLLTINLMVMLAYVAFETQHALRISIGIFGTFVAIVALRLLPEALAGRMEGDAVDYARAMMFLGASVALLHVLAQVKEQAAEARSAAAAMAELAHTDSLTGIANRRQLHMVLEDRVARAPHHDESLSVILLDIDHFKRINDTHGHDAGDAVLRRVAITLSGVVRATDLVGRWGGEEFLIIAPDTSPDDAAALAERCRASLAASTFPPVGSVTASLGVAAHRAGDTAWQLLRRADAGLYLAKEGGRDQVQHHDGGGWRDHDPVGAG